MKCGTIKCPCGQEFYFETVNLAIHCIACNRKHDVSKYPEKIEDPAEEEGTEGGAGEPKSSRAADKTPVGE
jgi:hypothetical protein